MKSLQPFLIALQFLTIIPIRLREPVEAKDIGASLLYYPLVGAIIASILLAVNYALCSQSNTVSAALVLTLWVILTGGLHLDGLADSADAWLGGLGDKERTLLIMKDPASGPIAVAILILVLLLKFIMLTDLMAQQDWLSLLIAIVLARAALPLLLITTPYVRKGGIATLLVDNIPHRHTHIMLAIVGLLIVLLSGLTLLACAVLLLLLLRYAMEQRLGGTTGDTAGAMVELLETAVLITAVII